MSDITCSAPRCSRPARAKSLCATHYQRQRRGGDLSQPVQPRGLTLVGELRVSPRCAERLDRMGGGSRVAAARAVLEAWAVSADAVEVEEVAPHDHLHARGAREPRGLEVGAGAAGVPMHKRTMPSPEAIAAAELLAPLPAIERERVLYGLRVALGLAPVPEAKLTKMEAKP